MIKLYQKKKKKRKKRKEMYHKVSFHLFIDEIHLFFL